MADSIAVTTLRIRCKEVMDQTTVAELKLAKLQTQVQAQADEVTRLRAQCTEYESAIAILTAPEPVA